MIKRTEFFAQCVLPFGLLSTLQDIRASVGDKASLRSLSGGYEGIWASVATSYNYMSPSHVDLDAFLSAITVSYVPYVSRHRKHFYKGKDLPIAAYMCFPLQGVAVGLRPGDILFFNPQYHHCVSGRTYEYALEKVHVTSFYMKTMQIGLIDNSIFLSNIEVVEDKSITAIIGQEEKGIKKQPTDNTHFDTTTIDHGFDEIDEPRDSASTVS
jgi:hypothetical protein